MTNDEKIIEFLRTHKETEQTKVILHHLFFLGEITQKTATEDYGITRLAAAVWKLPLQIWITIKIWAFPALSCAEADIEQSSCRKYCLLKA